MLSSAEISAIAREVAALLAPMLSGGAPSGDVHQVGAIRAMQIRSEAVADIEALLEKRAARKARAKQ
jgi:hypothetical protein